MQPPCEAPQQLYRCLSRVHKHGTDPACAKRQITDMIACTTWIAQSLPACRCSGARTPRTDASERRSVRVYGCFARARLAPSTGNGRHSCPSSATYCSSSAYSRPRCAAIASRRLACMTNQDFQGNRSRSYEVLDLCSRGGGAESMHSESFLTMKKKALLPPAPPPASLT